MKTKSEYASSANSFGKDAFEQTQTLLVGNFLRGSTCSCMASAMFLLIRDGLEVTVPNVSPGAAFCYRL